MPEFKIAGTRCLIEAETGDFVLAPKLEPFLLSGPSEPPDLRLALGVADGPLCPPSAPMGDVIVHKTGLEFIRRQGRLLAEDDFARCRVLLDPAPPEPFTGQPWLMLALWGYVTSHDGLLLHGGCCELDGKFFLLLGERQVGKSTLSRLVTAAGGACLTDEYPFATREDGTLMFHGSPWPGIVGLPPALCGPPAAIFYLRHAPENVLTPQPPKVAAQRLMTNNRFFTWSPRTLPVAFELLDQIAGGVPLFDFGFVPDESAVARLREVL